MIDWLISCFYYFLAFFLVINVIVIVHEYGHYLAAKKVGAKVVKFSIGMGPEIYGVTDKYGTRWCFSAFPVGGFVMMLGDGDIASATTDEEALQIMSEEEKKMTITSKSNWEKILVSFAGPFFNYVYAFVVLVIMGFSYGLPKYNAIIGDVVEASAAMEAGLQKNDKIIAIEGQKIEQFRELIQKIRDSDAEKFKLEIERNGKNFFVDIIPKIKEKKTLLGGVKKIRQIGITQSTPTFEKKTFFEAINCAWNECAAVTKDISASLTKLFSGKRSLDDFGSIVHMASVAGKLLQDGKLAMLIMFTITLSLNLGYINLLPLPILDGGNICICLIEQISGKKINQKAQEYIMIFFAILLILLMLIMMANDIIRFDAVNNFISNLLG